MKLRAAALCAVAVLIIIGGCGVADAGSTAAPSPVPEPETSSPAAEASTEPTREAAAEATPDTTAAPAETALPEASHSPAQEPEPARSEAPTSGGKENAQMKMSVTVNGVSFTATLENNAAARELAEMLPLTLELRDYGGFEKVGPLGARLTASNRQMTTRPGDIVLYSGEQIVMFTGSNSWSYTLLGRVDELAGWAEALGSGPATVTLALA